MHDRGLDHSFLRSRIQGSVPDFLLRYLEKRMKMQGDVSGGLSLAKGDMAVVVKAQTSKRKSITSSHWLGERLRLIPSLAFRDDCCGSGDHRLSFPTNLLYSSIVLCIYFIVQFSITFLLTTML